MCMTHHHQKNPVNAKIVKLIVSDFSYKDLNPNSCKKNKKPIPIKGILTAATFHHIISF